MALLSNAVRLATLGYFVGGSGTSAAFTAERIVFLSTAARRRFAYGQASITGVTDRAAVPEGYLPPYCWDMPQKPGGMASRSRILGTGVLAAAAHGGLDGVAPLTGSGTISNADAALILNAVANLLGSGTLAGDLNGIIEAVAALSGSGTLAGAATALAQLLASLSGSGTAVGASTATANASADITVSGGGVLTAPEIALAVWNAVAESGYSYADFIRVIAAVAAGKTTIDTVSGTSTVIFRSVSDDKTRIEATVQNGERVDVDVDAT